PLVEADRPEGDYPRPHSVTFTGVRQGFPMPNMTATDADRLAIRAAQLFCGFFLIQILIAPFFRNLPEGAGTLASAVAMVAYVIAVSRLPIMGKPITLATLGLRGPGMPRLVGIGVFGFLLELPVSLGLGLLGAKIFSFLPAPEHPATNALFDTPSLLNILGILFFGAIVAPFWEEIMFRGALFPAVSRLAKSPVVGGVVSCFLFAAIHPQGLALWFALASVAGFSCALVRYSRNLWPSIVLHFCHNATLLVLQVLIT
ncbi:CPBP family intramembrane metalloprotease, partial [bacterium]